MNAQAANEEDLPQFLTFAVGGEEFAAPVLRVREIVRYEKPTKVPLMPSAVRGVINLRGTVVPVVDLAARLGFPATAPTKLTSLVIVEVPVDGGLLPMGLLVDAVSEVIDLEQNTIEPAPQLGAKVHTEYLLGLGKLEGRFLLVLDVDRVLDARDLRAASQLGDAPVREERLEAAP